MSIFKRVNSEQFNSAFEFVFRLWPIFLLIWLKNLCKELATLGLRNWSAGWAACWPPAAVPSWPPPWCWRLRPYSASTRHCEALQARQILLCMDNSVADPWHFGTDPDPRIRGTARHWRQGKYYCAPYVAVLRIHDIFARIRIRGYAALRGIAGKANIVVYYVTVLRIHGIFARTRIRGYAALRGIAGKENVVYRYVTVLRIHVILVRIRIRRSMPWLMDPDTDPDPAIFVGWKVLERETAAAWNLCLPEGHLDTSAALYYGTTEHLREKIYLYKCNNFYI